MACKYLFNGITYQSYQELVDALSSDLGSARDLLFSKVDRNAVIQDQVVKAQKNKMSMQQADENAMTYDADVKVTAGNYSAKSFVESKYFNPTDAEVDYRMGVTSYITLQEQEMVKNKEASQEEAKAWGDAIRARWKSLGEDSANFHRLVLEDDPYQREQKVANTMFQSIPTKVEEAREVIINQVKSRLGLGTDSPGTLLENINLEAKTRKVLNGTEAAKIVGHIDYMIITPEGAIEIFNIKTSTRPYERWSSQEWTKYKYQMAIIKQILAYNGIDVKHVRMNVIPVQFAYNEQFDDLENIIVAPPQIIDSKNGQYTFKKYDIAAAQYVDSHIDPTLIEFKSLINAEKTAKKIIPDADIQMKNKVGTAKEWIIENWYTYVKYDKKKRCYVFEDPASGQIHYLKDTRQKEKNEELINLVQQKLDEEANEYVQGSHIKNLVSDIKRMLKERDLSVLSSSIEGTRRSYLISQFTKYINDVTTIPETGEVVPKWEIVESNTLNRADVLMLRNTITQQVDVLMLTNTDLALKYKSKFGRDNILGQYLDDVNSERFTMEYNAANVKAVEILSLINELIPSLGNNIKLGSLKIIGSKYSTQRKGAFYEFKQLLPEWNTMIRVANQNNTEKIQNNFNQVECISSEEILVQTWLDIFGEDSPFNIEEQRHLRETFNESNKRNKKSQFVSIEDIISIGNVEDKIQKLRDFLENLRGLLSKEGEGIHVGDIKSVLEAANGSKGPKVAILANAFVAATQALGHYYGDFSLENEAFSSADEIMMKIGSSNNSNVRKVGGIILKAIDNTRLNINDIVSNRIRPLCMQFYEDCHYTKFTNTVAGTQANYFNNLYVLDEDGNNTMMFKNPYDDSTDLLPHESKFLKGILYEFYRIKCAMNGKECDITGPSDQKLKDKMPQDYLWAPLEKASQGTERARILSDTHGYINQKYEQLKRYTSTITETTSDYVREQLDMFDAQDARNREEALHALSTYNKFTRSMCSNDERKSMINERGAQYFETNVENLIIDFVEEQIKCAEFKRTLVRIRGIELALLVSSITDGTTDVTEHTIKTIDDYISENIFRQSIMTDSSQKFDALLTPFKKLVSKFYIAGNLVGAVRDFIQGLASNFMRAAIKFQTDINVKDVLFAYKTVLGEGIPNVMSMTLLNQLNIRYAFSNFDAAKVSERLKSARGITNYENWAYAPLRGLDYLNRMILFVAKARHDGCFEAYSLDENHRLKYDWRKDKRYAALAAGDVNNPEYNRQRGRYMSMIRAFNLENPEHHLSYDDDLPDAYTLSQIRSIKTVSDSIYGAYDKASRQKVESLFIGRQFLYFFTWMNGMIDDYFKGTHVSEGEIEEIQETDYNGNLLYLNPDGTTTTNNTGIPAIKWVPITVQGVVHTYWDAIKVLVNGGSLSDMKTMLWGDKIRQRNVKRSISDLLMALIFAVLLKSILKDEYQEHKKKDNGKDVLANIATEFLYKGGTQAFDVFLGPVAPLQYFGENTNPASYTLQRKWVGDLWNLCRGNRDLGETAMNSQALLRSFHDSYKMYMRDTAPKKQKGQVTE